MRKSFLTICGSGAGIMLMLIAGRSFPSGNPVSGGQSYLEENGRKESVRHHLSWTDSRHVGLQTELEGKRESQFFVLDDSGETREWNSRDESRNSELEARLLPERTIILKGRHQGKPVKKTFKISRQPWNQLFQNGLGRFLVSPGEKTVFWAIGTRGKGELKITRFTVSRQPEKPFPPELQRFRLNGPYRHLKISLYGLLSVFWSGHYWYSARDNGLLFYKGKSSYLDGEVVLRRLEPSPGDDVP